MKRTFKKHLIRPSSKTRSLPFHVYELITENTKIVLENIILNKYAIALINRSWVGRRGKRAPSEIYF